MLQLYMIALVGMVVMRDALPGGGIAGGAEFSWSMVASALAPFIAIVLVVEIVCKGCGRRLDRVGSGLDVLRAERAVERGRLLAVVAHGAAVFAFGWVEQVRAVVGDVVAVDEMIAILPAAATIAAGWWSLYPIERRVREATVLRSLEEGDVQYPIPGRGTFVWLHVRHEMLLMLVPLAMVTAWGECVERGIAWAIGQRGGEGWAAGVGAWLARAGTERAALVRTGLQLAGVAGVFMIAPLALRMVWSTVRLGEGPMRDELLAICRRAGVRVREVLVWRTHGTMINGAAMGVIPAIRYILLTDALLDRLPECEVHAVMAHEVAHVKHRHIAWLIASMLATAGVAGTGMSIALAGVDRVAVRAMGIDLEKLQRESAQNGGGLVSAEGVRGGVDPELARRWEMWVVGSEGVATAVSLVVMFGVFGWVSRRFEWQADAFAAKHLSAEAGSGAGGGERLVTEEAVRAMAGALASVARLNHIPTERKSFRHGSIAMRIGKLEALKGRPVEGLRADVVAGRIKLCAAVGVVLVVGGMALGMWA